MDTYRLSSGNLNLVGAWFGTACLAFCFSILLLIYISVDQILAHSDHTYGLYQAVPQNQLVVSENVIRQDARAKIVEDFLIRHGSVLASFSEQFVFVADKYQLDFRLLPAIAMQESNGGKKMPKDSFNPFGYGIYGVTSLNFSSFEEAIEKVGKSLRVDYLNQGLSTPFEIMTKYTPQSVEKGGPWAINVNQLMYEQR